MSDIIYIESNKKHKRLVEEFETYFHQSARKSSRNNVVISNDQFLINLNKQIATIIASEEGKRCLPEVINILINKDVN